MEGENTWWTFTLRRVSFMRTECRKYWWKTNAYESREEILYEELLLSSWLNLVIFITNYWTRRKVFDKALKIWNWQVLYGPFRVTLCYDTTWFKKRKLALNNFLYGTNLSIFGFLWWLFYVWWLSNAFYNLYGRIFHKSLNLADLIFIL